jgi:hypothetical protein
MPTAKLNIWLPMATWRPEISRRVLDYPEKENNTWNFIKMDGDFMTTHLLLNKP